MGPEKTTEGAAFQDVVDDMFAVVEEDPPAEREEGDEGAQQEDGTEQ